MTANGDSFNVKVFELIVSLSTAADLVSPIVADHHQRVAYIALALARALGLSAEEQQQIALAAALHDIGALSLQERIDTLSFEVLAPEHHSIMGSEFLQRFEPFKQIARVVRHHHQSWLHGAGAEVQGEPVPLHSHLIHLADRVDILLDKQRFVLNQREAVLERIREQNDIMFMPLLVAALEEVAQRESFWLDIVSPGIEHLLEHSQLEPLALDLQGFSELARMLSHMIDFKSAYTSTHSAGVAATGEILAKLIGFAPADVKKMRIAGYLHDLGKLSVPSEIIEKPAGLTADEYMVMKGHTYYTRRVLESLPELNTISLWASSHHERMDGMGYPFRCLGADQPLGTRILAVADVFTALMEDRPYRRGLDQYKALEMLQSMALDGKLEPTVVDLVRLSFDEVNHARYEAQLVAAADYQDIMSHLPAAMSS